MKLLRRHSSSPEFILIALSLSVIPRSFKLNRILHSTFKMMRSPPNQEALQLPRVPPETPSCSQCKFYNPNKTCRKFTDIDLVSNDLVHPLAQSCRKDETQCGPAAVFYREKTEEDIQDEEDMNLWNDIKYPLLIYGLCSLAVYSHS